MKNTPLQRGGIVGSHNYEVVPFDAFWKSIPGVNAVIQHIDDFMASTQDVCDAYDSVAWSNQIFRDVLQRGILWAAKRL